MLKLTRKVGEKIYLKPSEDSKDMPASKVFSDDGIEIILLDVKSKQTSIGINAPKTISIIRDDAKQTKDSSASNEKAQFRLWPKFKNELIFITVIIISFLFLFSVKQTEYVGLIGSFLCLIVGAIYYSIEFFRGEQSFEGLYFYVCMMPFIILLFALIYKSMGIIPPGGDTGAKLNWLDAYYFSVVTWTTLGYGDFRPDTDIAKYSVMTEVLIGHIYMGIFIGKLLVLGTNRVENQRKK